MAARTLAPLTIFPREAATTTCMTCSHPSSSCASEHMVTAALIAASGNFASSATLMPTTTMQDCERKFEIYFKNGNR